MAEFHRTLRRGLPETPLMIVSQPVNPPRFTPESRAHLREFVHQASVALGDDPGIVVADASDLCDEALYTSSTHLTEAGHRRFAAWLAPRVLAAIESSPAATLAAGAGAVGAGERL